MDFSSKGLVMGGHSVHLLEESGLAQDRVLVTIDELPDDVLLEIFFYVNIRDLDIPNPWHALVHVCRRWRYLVFASPRHLNLGLQYRGHRPISKALGAWPVLPLSLISIIRPPSKKRWDNIVTALESKHSNRISEINVNHPVTNRRWQRFTAAIQKPFPELTHLRFWTLAFDVVRVLPDSKSFLGGSAPRLRTLYLGGVPFPSIPKFLLSANGLVELTLFSIPDSGYFSPNAMVTALTVMTRLEFLRLEFGSPRSRPDPEGRPLPPPTRFVLSALTQLTYQGDYKYLEDLLAQIDAPRLYYLHITFFMDLNFDVPQLRRFIDQVEEFKIFDRADVWISNYSIQLCLYPNPVRVDDHRRLKLQIKSGFGHLDPQLSSLCQVCTLTFPLISALEELQIMERDDWLSLSHWKDDMENTQWLELLDPYTSLKNLYLTDGIAQRCCSAPFKNFPEKGQRKCYPPYAIFSYGGLHWNLSKKPSSHSLLRDSSTVILCLSTVGRTEAG